MVLKLREILISTLLYHPFLFKGKTNASSRSSKDVSTKPKKRKDKEANTSYGGAKCHIVLSGKRNIVGVEDKTDMSEDYEKFHEIAPFTVNIDPSIQLND